MEDGGGMMKTDWHIGIGFDPRDLWVGFYWDKKTLGVNFGGKWLSRFDLFICIIPMFPIHIYKADRLAYK